VFTVLDSTKYLCVIENSKKKFWSFFSDKSSQTRIDVSHNTDYNNLYEKITDIKSEPNGQNNFQQAGSNEHANCIKLEEKPTSSAMLHAMNPLMMSHQQPISNETLNENELVTNVTVHVVEKSW